MAETLRSSAKVSAAVMASRVFGVVRDSLFVAIFGVSWQTDAYYIAFRIPNLLRDLFAEGALSSAFVPTFSDALAKHGKERAFAVGNLVLTGVVLVTSIFTLLGILFAEPIVALLSASFRASTEHGVLVPPNAASAAAKLEVAIFLSRVMMPILLLVSISAVFMGMLNAQRRFTAPAWAPALFNITSIVAGTLIWAFDAHGERGLVIWSIATTGAAAVQAFCQLPSLWRLGFRPRIVVTGLLNDPALRRIVRLMAPASIGLAAIQLNVFVNTHFAGLISEGAVTQLQTAFRLFYVPVGVFGVALAVVTTSRVADEAARGDRVALRERTAEGAQAVFMLASASAVGLIVLADPVLTVLFERGKFGRAETLAIVPVLRAYMLGVLPYSLVKIYAPAFYSLDRPRRPMVASLLAVASNLVFNAATYRWLGAPGLALGTTIAAVVNFAILRFSFSHLVGPPRRPGWFRDMVSLVLGNVALGVAAWGSWLLGDYLFAAPGEHLRGAVAALWLAATIGGAFWVYVLTLRLLRYPGADELAKMPLRILRRFMGRPAAKTTPSP
ncbi:MAG TPA: murein biosynthesis integral membrane protein MurJ [Polyangia bacterium]